MTFNIFSSGASALANPDNEYEYGLGANHTGLQITTGAAATPGSYGELIAATSAAWAGFWLQVTAGSNSRFLVDLATGAAAAETVVVPNVPVLPSTVGAGVQLIFIPLNIAAGQRIAVRARCSSATQNLVVGVTGVKRNANSLPLFNNCESVAPADLTNTRASTTTITPVSNASPGTGWTTLTASAAHAYGAIIPFLGTGASNPATAQTIGLRLATGAASSEAVFYEGLSATTAVNPYFGPRGAPTIYKAIPAGVRIAMETLVGTTGDAYVCQALAFF